MLAIGLFLKVAVSLKLAPKNRLEPECFVSPKIGTESVAIASLSKIEYY